MIPAVVEEYLKELKEQLKLSKEGYKKLLKLAEEQYEKAKIAPGEAVGVVAAQSIGEPGTQLTMRTKWFAGASEMSVTQGLPRLIEIFDAKKEPSTPTMMIYLKPSYATSEAKVRQIANKILEVSFGDVISEMNVDLEKMRVETVLDPEKLESFGIDESTVQAKIKEAFKTAKVTFGHYKINVAPKGEDVDLAYLYKLKVKLASTHISGVKNITQVMPVKIGDRWVLKTAGSNLREILKMKEVDIENTKTNDIFEIYNVLGIEAARNAIIEEAKEVLDSQGIEVDVRHLMLVADVMTHTGAIRSIGRYGVSGEKASVLARASFEVPLRHLFNAAVYGETDELNSVVENVMINQPIPVGTGVVDLVVKKEDKGD